VPALDLLHAHRGAPRRQHGAVAARVHERRGGDVFPAAPAVQLDLGDAAAFATRADERGVQTDVHARVGGDRVAGELRRLRVEQDDPVPRPPHRLLLVRALVAQAPQHLLADPGDDALAALVEESAEGQDRADRGCAPEEGVLLDEEHAGPRPGGADRRPDPARTATDDNDVVSAAHRLSRRMPGP
jgi:hypothetical protein